MSGCCSSPKIRYTFRQRTIGAHEQSICLVSGPYPASFRRAARLLSSRTNPVASVGHIRQLSRGAVARATIPPRHRVDAIPRRWRARPTMPRVRVHPNCATSAPPSRSTCKALASPTASLCLHEQHFARAAASFDLARNPGLSSSAMGRVQYRRTVCGLSRQWRRTAHLAGCGERGGARLQLQQRVVSDHRWAGFLPRGCGSERRARLVGLQIQLARERRKGFAGRGEFIPSFAQIKINEVLAHTDLPQVDSIELFNPTTNSVSIGGWFITDDFMRPRSIAFRRARRFRRWAMSCLMKTSSTASPSQRTISVSVPRVTMSGCSAACQYESYRLLSRL